MSNLVIKLSGEIQNSNFEEWKSELIGQIRSVNSELKTDSEFATATKSVKKFKAAEKALKEAKESAIEQAADINQLFDAIDAIAEETRQVRLSLERQIKARKVEIKEEAVKSGMEIIKVFIAQQSEDFQLISKTPWLDENHFEEAIKGKASTKGMDAAVKKLCAQLKKSIEEKVLGIKNNASVLDNLQIDHRSLFQDRAALLDMPAVELNATIDKRIEVWKSQQDKSTETRKEPKEIASSDKSAALVSEKAEAEENWQVSINLHATKSAADQWIADLKVHLDDDKAVTGITLSAAVQ